LAAALVDRCGNTPGREVANHKRRRKYEVLYWRSPPFRTIGPDRVHRVGNGCCCFSRRRPLLQRAVWRIHRFERRCPGMQRRCMDGGGLYLFSSDSSSAEVSQKRPRRMGLCRALRTWLKSRLRGGGFETSGSVVGNRGKHATTHSELLFEPSSNATSREHRVCTKQHGLDVAISSVSQSGQPVLRRQ
jgi:hypothetical protein